jgi:hypothetical protein
LRSLRRARGRGLWSQHERRDGDQPKRELDHGWRKDFMTIYDISHPYDLRLVLNKPAISTEELDWFLADPAADPEVKRQLLADVQRQGYKPGSTETESPPP